MNITQEMNYFSREELEEDNCSYDDREYELWSLVADIDSFVKKNGIKSLVNNLSDDTYQALRYYIVKEEGI